MSIADREAVWLAALLHDLGKFQQRGFPGRTAPHEEYSRRFVEEDLAGYFQPCGDDLAHAIAHHHHGMRANRQAEKVLILADWLSANERENEERVREKPAHAALVSLLTRRPIAAEGTTEKRFPLVCLDWTTEAGFFPVEGVGASPEAYSKLWQQFREEFGRLAGQRGYRSADLTTMAALLRKYTARMPSATPWQKSDDAHRTGHLPVLSPANHCGGGRLSGRTTRSRRARAPAGSPVQEPD